MITLIELLNLTFEVMLVGLSVFGHLGSCSESVVCLFFWQIVASIWSIRLADRDVGSPGRGRRVTGRLAIGL
jgi:hypothetical protein